MTNELEKQFFQCFGIEQKYEDGTCDMDGECRHTDCSTCQRINKFNYPQITDRILLELICIIGSIYICTQDRESLKEHILVQCMNTQMYGGDIKHQIRTLFEER